MTLNGEMTLILRYFTEFLSFRGALRKSSWQSHNYGQFTISMSSSKRLERNRADPTFSRFDNTGVWHTDTHTDTRTHDDGYYPRIAMAPRG